MGAERRRYNMYPQKTYGGHVETQVLDDGRIKYFIFLVGADEPSTMVVDPLDENAMRGVRQLHLIINKGAIETTAMHDYVIDGDDVDEVLAHIQTMFRRAV
jgi:type IV secretory pathway VirB9-like protein